MTRFIIPLTIDKFISMKNNTLGLKFKAPNFDLEWEEAIRYPEFEEMGKEKWLDLAAGGYLIKYSEIKGMLGNVDLRFDSLEEPKKLRFQRAIREGRVELSIVVKFSDQYYDLMSGNTRLAGLVRMGIDPPLWVIPAPDTYYK
jgi:hypothetical protein